MSETSSAQVMKVDGVGRVHTPLEKRLEIIRAYESSGMTGRQFAEYCGVRYSTLMTWAKRHGSKPPAPKTSESLHGGWVEALIEAPQGDVLEVCVGGTVRMRVGSKRQAELAGVVLGSLGYPGSC